jgi:hypothetical protein
MLFLGVDSLKLDVVLTDAILDAYLLLFFVFFCLQRLRRNIDAHIFLLGVTDVDQVIIHSS